MPAIWDQVAEEVKNEINAQDFGIAFIAVRSKEDVEIKLENLDSIRVDVCSWGRTAERFDASTMKYRCTTRIVVRKRFSDAADLNEDGTIKNDSTDPYDELLQKILEFFCPVSGEQSGRALVNLPDTAWDDEENATPSRSGSMLMEAGLFVGFVDVTYAAYVTPGRLQ